MEQFFPSVNYVGHSQSIPQESKLATYAAIRNTTTGNGDVSHHLTQSLQCLSLDGASNATGGIASIDGVVFQKPASYGHGDDTSPLGNGSGSPTLSRDPTPIPPVTYQSHMWVEQENVGGTTYYYAEEAQQADVPDDISGPLLFPNYSLYSGPPSHLKDYTPRLGSLPPLGNPVVHPTVQPNSYFMNEDIRQEIIHKNAVSLAQPNRQMYPDLPLQVEHFTEICPLEPITHQSATFGYATSAFKAVNMKTGFTYCLRRIHGFRFPSGKCLGLIDAWKQLCHSNMVTLREVFTTKAFSDSSLVFVYDYFPAAESLMTRHFDRSSQANDPFNTGDPSVPRPYSHQKNALLRHHANMLPENLLWSYVVQMSSIIRTIHAAGLAVRSLDPTKVLAVSKTRPSIRLNCCGIYDIVGFDPANNQVSLNQFYQLEDLLALGKLILALACNSLLAIQHENLATSLDLISRTYSSDLRNLIVYLMNPRGSGNRTINDIMPMIGARFYNQLDASCARADLLEDCVAKECENGRLLRITVKLNTVVERQELNMDPSWTETGERYLLKLFREYVFHQVTPDGRPWLDLAHVIYCLNRLDAGIQERLTLTSRDGRNILITTFAELKMCLDHSFTEVLGYSEQHHLKNSLGGTPLMSTSQ